MKEVEPQTKYRAGHRDCGHYEAVEWSGTSIAIAIMCLSVVVGRRLLTVMLLAPRSALGSRSVFTVPHRSSGRGKEDKLKGSSIVLEVSSLRAPHFEVLTEVFVVDLHSC